MQTFLPYLMMTLIPVFFVLVTLLISVIGGWNSLSKEYPFNAETVTNKENPIRINGISLTLGFLGNYRNCISVTEYNEGIKIQPFFLFRLMHAPVFLRWEDMKEATMVPFLFFSRLHVRIFGRTLIFSGFGVKKLEMALKNKTKMNR